MSLDYNNLLALDTEQLFELLGKHIEKDSFCHIHFGNSPECGAISGVGAGMMSLLIKAYNRLALSSFERGKKWYEEHLVLWKEFICTNPTIVSLSSDEYNKEIFQIILGVILSKSEIEKDCAVIIAMIMLKSGVCTFCSGYY